MYEVLSDLQRDGLQILIDMCGLPFYSDMCLPYFTSMFGSIRNHVSLALNNGYVLSVYDFPKRARVRLHCSRTCSHSDLLSSQNSSWVKINFKLAVANNTQPGSVYTNMSDLNTDATIFFFKEYVKDILTSSCSFWQIIHFIQISLSGKVFNNLLVTANFTKECSNITGSFRQYDYGLKENYQLYGTKTPPDYDLSNITTKVHILYAGNDKIIPKEVSNLTPYGLTAI